jgi:hypothetical protein
MIKYVYNTQRQPILASILIQLWLTPKTGVAVKMFLESNMAIINNVTLEQLSITEKYER